MTDIRTVLITIRLEHNQKLKDMAENLGVSSAFLSAVENNKKSFPESWYEKFKTIYNLSDEEISQIKEAALYSRKVIELNLENASDESRKLAVKFARSFNTLDKKTQQDMLDLLK